MKAAVWNAETGLRLEHVERPEVGPDDVLVKVGAASICGTDLRISRHGHFKIPAGTSRILGHEVSGTVAATGANVTSLAVGRRVSVTPNVGCGRCEWCGQGLNNMCADYEAFGVSIDGGFAEYLLVPGFAVARGNVFPLPDTVSNRAAALVEPFSCCLRGQRALRVGNDDTVVIVGAGPIGIFHTMLAKLAGARTVIVSNLGAKRLDDAAEAGADVLVQSDRQDLLDVVARVTGGRGADVVITCVSSPEVQAQAVEMLATHGRVNFFAGLGGDARVPLDTNRLHYKGLTLTGTTGSSNDDYRRALSLVADGRVDLERLVTRTFAIDEVDKAFHYAAVGEGMKAMVTFDDTERE